MPDNITFYKGSNWVTITPSFAEYVIERFHTSSLTEAFQASYICDELFFQTIAHNSSFKNAIYNNNLRFIDWKRKWDKPFARPHTFTMKDFDRIMKSDQIFARKFDMEVDEQILFKLREHISSADDFVNKGNSFNRVRESEECWMEDLVSVIMPAYNCEKYIGEAIQSVIDQTYKNWELIIVNDCSTDTTESIIRQYTQNEPRIQYIKLSTNAGPAAARNTAMANAKGRYNAFLDSDDLWMQDKLEKQIAFMQEHSCKFSYTRYRKINEFSLDIGEVVGIKPKVDYKSILYSNTIGNSTAVYDAQALGRFQIPDIRKRNDLALWLNILQNEKYAYGMEDVLSAYRVRENSISNKKRDLIQYHWQIYRDIAKLSVIQSIWHMGYWMVDKSLRKI